MQDYIRRALRQGVGETTYATVLNLVRQCTSNTALQPSITQSFIAMLAFWWLYVPLPVTAPNGMFLGQTCAWQIGETGKSSFLNLWVRM